MDFPGLMLKPKGVNCLLVYSMIQFSLLGGAREKSGDTPTHDLAGVAKW